MKINTKNIGMLALLAMLLIGVVLISGCTNAPEKKQTSAPEKKPTSEQRSAFEQNQADIEGLKYAYNINYDDNAGRYKSDILDINRIHMQLAADQGIAISQLSSQLPIEELKGSVITEKDGTKYVTLNKIEIETGSFKILKDNENKNEIILDTAITLKIGDKQETINTIYATDAQITSLLGEDGQMFKGSEIDWDRIKAVNNARVAYLKSYDTMYNIKIDYTSKSYKFAGSAPKDDSFMTDTKEMYKRALQGENDFQKISGPIYKKTNEIAKSLN